jgi:UDP-N-acetylmuramoyl-L-alanyl-D-glutamate--2,6-diaminopimelate ligase
MLVRDCLGLGRLLQGDAGTAFTSVTYDSRQARPGSLFVAIPGFRYDGHQFVPQAVEQGAVALVVERPVAVPPHMAVLQVPSSRKALGEVAAALHRHPSRRIRVIGVTGTNGKTTTTHLIRAILMEKGYRAGLIGTVQNYVGDLALPVERTTPEAPDVHSLLAQMAEIGSQYCVMEVSSHALDLYRVDTVEFDGGVFTNLTQDHLDFHGDLQRYRAAKGKLFVQVGRPGFKTDPKTVVLNYDDPSSPYYASLSRTPVITYGLSDEADLRAVQIDISSRGTRYKLLTPVGSVDLNLKLAGRFNVYNSLAAAAVCLAEGIDLETIRRALEKSTGVAGRLEPVNAGQPFGVFVDYAHTPDGLENVLRTAQGFARGRVIVVFGCGGDRDRTKRPKMGRIAGQLADYTIITSDNPRMENPDAIVREIEAGVVAAAPGPGFYETEVDRRTAIGRAVAVAGPDDVVLIAGKGHETYQIFADRTVPFDDREVARRQIEALLARQGGTA